MCKHISSKGAGKKEHANSTQAGITVTIGYKLTNLYLISNAEPIKKAKKGSLLCIAVVFLLTLQEIQQFNDTNIAELNADNGRKHYLCKQSF